VSVQRITVSALWGANLHGELVLLLAGSRRIIAHCILQAVSWPLAKESNPFARLLDRELETSSHL